MKNLCITVAFALLVYSPALAQGTSMDHSQHMKHGAAPSENLPKEPGQSAFAAIQEIVDKLVADPNTDWSKVDIESLRQHLIDMDAVTLRAKVQTTQTANAIEFMVTGDGGTVGSIQRMTLGHAKTMNGKDGLQFETEATETGVLLRVLPTQETNLQKIAALGFLGIMTMGLHHQEHHWMLARGLNSHN